MIIRPNEKMLEIFENTANWGRFQDVWFKFFGLFWIIFCISHELLHGRSEPYSEDQINSAPFYDPDRYRKRNEKIENATRMRNEKDYSELFRIVQLCLAGVSVLGRRLEITFFINEVVFYSKNQQVCSCTLFLTFQSSIDHALLY